MAKSSFFIDGAFEDANFANEAAVVAASKDNPDTLYVYINDNGLITHYLNGQSIHQTKANQYMEAYWTEMDTTEEALRSANNALAGMALTPKLRDFQSTADFATSKMARTADSLKFADMKDRLDKYVGLLRALRNASMKPGADIEVLHKKVSPILVDLREALNTLQRASRPT